MNVDSRTQLGRRYHDIMNAILQDQGGRAVVAEARLQLVRRFAASALQAELMEGKLVSGEEIDVALHALLISSLCRLANKLGIDRTARDITPSLSQYLATTYEPDTEAAE
jgi:uncharacterized protein (UPF0371 family)